MFVFVFLEVKQEETTPIKQENTESTAKEEKTNVKPVAFDNRVSTITAVKSEPNAAPVVRATSVRLSQLSKEEEVEWAVVRSSQQAKIPLKKRDLKLADSFHSNHLNNSSIIVCNPAAVGAKDGKLLNALGPPGGAASSQQVLTAPRQELTNGRAPHGEGQNGVIGVVGQVVGHIGVIRSPSEFHRAPVQLELNGPSSEPRGGGDKEAGRQSVLVRKGPTERETPGVTLLPPDTKRPSSSLKPDGPPEATERSAGPVGAASQEELGASRRQEESESGTSRRQEKEESGASRRREKEESRASRRREEARKEAPELNEAARVKGGNSESSRTVLSLKIHKWDKTDLQGLNGELASRVRVKSSGFASEPSQGPLEEASSELQKEGIRLKIKIPPHRRNKLKKKGGKEEEKEREVQEEGRSLRRSTRICRYVWGERENNKTNTPKSVKYRVTARICSMS